MDIYEIIAKIYSTAIIILIIAFLIFRFIKKKYKKANYNKKQQTSKIIYEQVIDEDTIENDYTIEIQRLPYMRKYLLTKNEYFFYKQLRQITDARKEIVLVKIRMADLIDVQKGLDQKTWGTYFAKIKSKHADFVICDDNLNIKLIVELDDNSHYNEKRIKRDMFINKAYSDAGYRIIHVRNIQEYINQTTVINAQI